MPGRVRTGIEGMDFVTGGGLPRGRALLVSGTAGAGKTIFATAFLAGGLREEGEGAVFCTLEESPAAIRRNLLGLGYDIAAWEEEEKWTFVDGSPAEENVEIRGPYDLGALVPRIEHAVEKVGATRVVVDSLGAILARFPDADVVRTEFFRLARTLRRLDVTAVITAERIEEYGPIARYGFEEFVADHVVVLRNHLAGESRRRTVEVLKMRGGAHRQGEYPFTIRKGKGPIVMAAASFGLNQPSSDVRISTGNETFDAMCRGGLFRDAITLVSGASGTGKTLLASHFAAAVEEEGRALYLAHEESEEQLARNARSWGLDLAGLVEEGRLEIICSYPESRSLEDHLIVVRERLEELRPRRVVVDSLSALARGAAEEAFRGYVLGLTSILKRRQVAGLLTATTRDLQGSSTVTEGRISTLTDTIVLLRYLEVEGEVTRGLALLKMRGSDHDRAIRELVIGDDGYEIGDRFVAPTGLFPEVKRTPS